MKDVYVLIFAPLLVIVMVATIGFIGMFGLALKDGPASAPVTTGVAQVMDTVTPAQAAANVVAAPALPAGEEAQVQPQGQPQNIPAPANP